MSYWPIAIFIRGKFFTASVSRAEIFQEVPPLRIARVLFVFVLFFFPILFIMITFLDMANSGGALNSANLILNFLSIFPTHDYLRLLIKVPIFTIIVAFIYNKLPKLLFKGIIPLTQVIDSSADFR